jgi:hypothetical protein
MGIGRVSCWAEGKGVTRYSRAKLNGNNVSIHRLLLPDSEMVDHISRDGLDNRRVNIREADAEINGRNRRKHCRNTSGESGVNWVKRCGKWAARINFDGKRQFLGYFTNKEDAIDARNAAKKENGYL